VVLLGRSQANISQHLAILRAAGLVVDEREGNRILYRLNDGWLLWLLELLAGEREEAARAFRQEVWRVCSCPRCSQRREQEEIAHR
jgi:DNA-binding transcriptional ArsR family regulator